MVLVVVLTTLVIFIIIVLILKKLIEVLQKWNLKRMLAKWTLNSPKDKVVLHSLWRGKTLPSGSPFGFKLETYLRMAKIPYELETKDVIGPKGKLPWITYNGTHVADSQFSIQFLNKLLSVNLNTNTTEEHLASARACRIMLEEQFFWGMAHYRLVVDKTCIPKIMNLPAVFKYSMPLQTYLMKKKMDGHGIGKHTSEEIFEVTEDALCIASKILGNKMFFGGNEPCEEDCAIFGMLSQAVWGLPGSSFEKLMNGELSNLKEYCFRIKELYWSDWEDILDTKN